MRRSSSALVRRTHSSSISRQAQLLPITSTAPLPPPAPELRSSASPTPSTEKVKEWVDIFDGPMRPPAFVPRPSSPPPTHAPTREGDKGVSSIIFDGPARPRYIIPGAYAQPQRTERGSKGETRKGSVSGTDVAALLSRSSLPPPRIYDGPAFEWELQTKRV